MAETTLHDITQAAADEDLTARLASAAAEAGIPHAETWVQTNGRRIVSRPVTEGGDTVASVYAYAVATHQPAPRPGQNPAAVTDAHLRAAVAATYDAVTS